MRKLLPALFLTFFAGPYYLSAQGVVKPHHGAGGASVDKFPEGVKQQPLLKLEEGEHVITNESSLAISSGKTAGDYNFSYSIATQKGRDFYVTTNKGRRGPFKQIPQELLPPAATGKAEQFSNLFELRIPAADDNTRFGKHISISMSDQKILVDKKVFAMKQDQSPGQYAYDEASGKYAVVVWSFSPSQTMQEELITNTGVQMANKDLKVSFLMSPFSKEFYFVMQGNAGQPKTLTDEKGDILAHFQDQVYITADRKSYIYKSSGNDYGISVNDQVKWRLKQMDGVHFFFTDDGSRWVSVSGYGMEFSDGSKAGNAVLPVFSKNNNKTSLHFLLLTRDYEIIACSMDW